MELRSVDPATAPSTGSEIGRLPLDFLLGHVDPQNAKEHDLGAIIQSIVRHGFVGHVTLDPGVNMLVAGEGRILALAAMRADGYDAPERIEGENWQVPTYLHRFADEYERHAYLIADNRLTELGGWDTTGLIDLLEENAKRDSLHGLDGTGYDMDDLDALIAARDYEPPPRDEPESVGPLEERYGIAITVKDEAQEGRIAELLIGHGFTHFTRFSEG